MYNIRVEDIMVRDLRYITLSSTYRDVQEALMIGQLRTLALVESKGESATSTSVCLDIGLATPPWANLCMNQNNRSTRWCKNNSTGKIM